MWATEGQKRRIRVLVIAIVLLLSWITISNRPTLSQHDTHLQGQTTQPFPPKLSRSEQREEVVVNDEEESEGLNRLGSRPPNCGHKCGSCSPCEAIQVPTFSQHFGVQSANYEPEGWKCKCGDSYFDPQ